MKNNFHPRSWSTSFRFRMASRKVSFNAFRNGPLMSLGTAFMVFTQRTRIHFIHGSDYDSEDSSRGVATLLIRN